MDIVWQKEIISIDLMEFLAPAMKSDELNDIYAITENDNHKYIVGYINGKLSLAFAVRIENMQKGREFVVVVGASIISNGFKKSMPIFEALAKQNECQYIRIHTNLSGLERQMIRNDYYISEKVYKKKV